MIRFYIFAPEQIRERIVWFIKHFGQQTEIKICKEKNNDKFAMARLNYYLIVKSRQSIGHAHRSILLVGVLIHTADASPFTCVVIFCKIVLCKIMFLADKEKQNCFNILI